MKQAVWETPFGWITHPGQKTDSPGGLATRGLLLHAIVGNGRRQAL